MTQLLAIVASILRFVSLESKKELGAIGKVVWATLSACYTSEIFFKVMSVAKLVPVGVPSGQVSKTRADMSTSKAVFS